MPEKLTKDMEIGERWTDEDGNTYEVVEKITDEKTGQVISVRSVQVS
jgi:hypothetical protein